VAQYSENVSRLTRALIPPKPGEREQQELYEQVGRAIVGLSNAENTLAVIFCILSMPVELEVAKSLFADQGSFERKLKLVNFSVLQANDPEEMKEWSAIYKELNTHRGVRNLVAHQRMLVDHNNRLEAEVSLTPLFYKQGGKSLRTAEIRVTADELEQINRKLWAFIKCLDKVR
jgi:hypothetical protein